MALGSSVSGGVGFAVLIRAIEMPLEDRVDRSRFPEMVVALFGGVRYHDALDLAAFA